MKKSCDFAAIGYCGIDSIAIVPSIPLDSKVEIIESFEQGGGPAATAAVAAARLGADTVFIGSVGDDSAGNAIIEEFASENVDTSHIAVRKGGTSPRAYCWIEANTGKRSIAWTRGKREELASDEVDEELIRNSRICHLDGHQMEAALAAAKIAAANNIPVSLDAGTIRPGIEKIIEFTDILISSEEFARRYTGESDNESALRALGKNGAAVTAVTMGEKGSMALGKDGEIIRCPAFKITPVDTTGAGDVFHGAFCVRYLETKDVYECMRFASAVSALKCLKSGGRTGIPSRAEVDEFLKRFCSRHGQ